MYSLDLLQLKTFDGVLHPVGAIDRSWKSSRVRALDINWGMKEKRESAILNKKSESFFTG